MKFTKDIEDEENSDYPESILPENRGVNSLKKLVIIDWDPKEIARQLTLIDFELLCEINLENECFVKSFSLENRIKNAPGFHSIIERTNDFALFITFEIVKEENIKKRIKIFEHFIFIAKECIEIGNFASGFSILGGLNSSNVFRLKKTFESISKKSKDIFDELNQLLDSRQNFKNLRKELKETLRPCIPYIGLFMSDLLSIQETNPDTLQNGLINFQKRILISTIIHDLGSYRLIPYKFRTLLDLHQLLINLEIPFTQEHLKKLSLKCEGGSKDSKTKGSIIKFMKNLKETKSKYSGLSSEPSTPIDSSIIDSKTISSPNQNPYPNSNPNTNSQPSRRSPILIPKDAKDLNSGFHEQLKSTLRSRSNPNSPQTSPRGIVSSSSPLPEKSTSGTNLREASNKSNQKKGTFISNKVFVPVPSTVSTKSSPENSSHTKPDFEYSIFSKKEITDSKQNLRKMVNTKSFKRLGKIEKSDFVDISKDQKEPEFKTIKLKKTEKKTSFSRLQNLPKRKTSSENMTKRKTSSENMSQRKTSFNMKISPIMTSHQESSEDTISLNSLKNYKKMKDETSSNFNSARSKFENPTTKNLDEIEKEKQELLKKKNKRNSWDENSSSKTKNRKSIHLETGSLFDKSSPLDFF